MKKKVNGKVVDINIDIFEAGFEGLALHKSAASNISDTIESESKIVKTCVESYHKIYRSLPFPLYCIENNIKYATAAMFIQDDIRIATPMWVDKALYIKIEDNKALKIVGSTWAIVSVDKIPEDNTNIEYHKEEVGYREFKWVLSRLMNEESLASFYSTFMGKFVEACNNEPMILKWELGRILDFGYVPNKLELKENKIIDIENECEYNIDVYCNGKRKSTENILEITIGGSNVGINKKSKYIKLYDFDVYKKSTKTSDDTGDKIITKMEKSSMDCMGALFEKIISKGSLDDTVEDVIYSGISDGRYMVFQIYGTIYYCRADRYVRATEIAKNVSIFAYENGRVYMLKTYHCDSGAYKDTIYAYDLDTKSLRLCKISYRV